jgi:hypothetical protein
MRVAGWGEERDATVIRETSQLCRFFLAGKSRCRNVAADLSRSKKLKLLGLPTKARGTGGW